MMTLAFVFAQVAVIVVAVVLMARPLWEVALGRPLKPASVAARARLARRRWYPWRLCVLARYCTPCVECCLALQALGLGLGFALTPGVMATNPAWHELEAVAGQEFWATAALGLGVGQVGAVVADRPGLRMLCLVLTLVWWWRVSWALAAWWPEGTGVFQFGSLALISCLALLTFAWEAGHRGRDD